MREREVERERDSDSVDDRVTKARELSESLRDLRESRRERIEQELAQNTTRSENDAFDGWVKGYTPAPASVDVDVAYVDDGEEHVKTFTLDRPRTADDYHVDNEFVRFVRHVGDGGPTDVEATLEREVPLTKEDGEVMLDLPPSDGVARLGHQVRRAVDGSDLFGWEATRRRATTGARVAVASVAVGLAAFGWQAILSAEAYPNSILPVDVFMGGLLYANLAFVFTVFWLLGFGIDGELNEKAVGGLLGIVAAAVTTSAGLGLVPLGDPTGTVTVPALLSSSTTGGGLVLVAGAAYVVRDEVKRALTGGREKLRRFRRRFQMWRGVEHVRD